MFLLSDLKVYQQVTLLIFLSNLVLFNLLYRLRDQLANRIFPDRVLKSGSGFRFRVEFRF